MRYPILLISFTLFTQTFIYGQVRDINGNVYKSTKIGTQTWMSENLNVKNFRNGDPIPEAKSKEEWEKASKDGLPAWCYYNNDSVNGKKYGKLYNLFAVIDPRGLAPIGWHIPNDAEWNQLDISLGGNDQTGNKMKSSDGWDGNNNGTNESGFNGRPFGIRDRDGDFGNHEIIFELFGKAVGWWSSSVSKSSLFGVTLTVSNIFYLNISNNLISRKEGETTGIYVRCVKDFQNN